jgi:hypothetical protein
MAGVMVATFIVAVRWLPRGRLEYVDDEELVPAAAAEQGTVTR